MKSGSWASYQSALPLEARAGGERDDDAPSPHVLRPDLEKPTARIVSLPIYRGYPVPWFVSWINGVPEFRAADAQKWMQAVQMDLCWVCGHKLGRHKTFVAGPMCGINRTSAEPPCHLDCAQWSARNCPFLSKPQMVRRENNLPEDAGCAGVQIRRNPGATLLWTVKDYKLFGDGNGGVLIDMGMPLATEWWAEGKPATREQVVASVESGLPILLEIAQQEEGAVDELMRRKAWLETKYPK